MKESSSLWLHLFTSTIRELYIADAIDILAAPAGAHYQFRYEGKYVAAGIHSNWRSDGLAGTKVAVCFSILHPANYHAAMYLPLRSGEVIRTWTDGSAFHVVFRLGKYMPLGDASVVDSEVESDEARRANDVRRYTESVQSLLGGEHPDTGTHAVVGPPPPASATSNGDDGRDFEALVRYLSPAMYFSPRIYYRLAEVEDSSSGTKIQVDTAGSLQLKAGNIYTIKIVHFQLQAPGERANLVVTLPDGVSLLTSNKLALRSKYDSFLVRIFVKFRDDESRGELAITPSDELRGPTVRLPVVIRPSTGHAISGPLLGVGGATAVLIPPILASPDQHLALRIALAILGGALAGLGLWLRRRRGLPG